MLDTDYERYTLLKLTLLWQGRNFHVLKYFSKFRLGWALPCDYLPSGCQPHSVVPHSSEP